MKRLIAICGVLSVGLFGLACSKEKKKEEPPKVQEEPKPQVAEKPKAKKKSPPKTGLSPDKPKTKLEIPTVAELEKEAAKRIKPENLESELDRLEAEIVGVPN